MSNGIDALFGPLSKTYCYYFFIMSVFALFSLVLYAIAAVIMAVKSKTPGKIIFHSIGHLIAIGLLYLETRLLYNMCSNSL